MTPDQELVLLFGGLHLVALLFACGLFWMFLRADTVKPWEPDDEDDSDGGGGGNDRLQDPPKPPKPGGIPLPDAAQSPERFRGPGRLAERHPFPARRPERKPDPSPERV
ncbi:MAG: hypothetical protein WKF94_09825 [Solirubrobacteraceae bacterium]